MNALVAKEAKVQPALRVQACGVLRVVLAEAHGPQGQQDGHLGPALVGRHALWRYLFDRLHWMPVDFSNLYPERIMDLETEAGNPRVAEDFMLVRANAKA